MTTKLTLLATIAIFAALGLAAACGGDGDDGGGGSIRTRQGLGVAALVANAQTGAEDAGGAELGLDVAIGAPAPQADEGVERGGVAYPDIAPFPSFQESQSGITVQGFGSATVDADSAVLELYFGGMAIRIEPFPAPGIGEIVPPSIDRDEASGAPGEPELLEEAQPITEADLQPVVDAITARGVSAADIEVIVEPFYGEPYYGGSATIRVTVSEVDDLEGVVEAAAGAASDLENVAFQGSSVSYSAGDCAALELAAMQAAVEDARQRGETFASALGVGLGAVAGASHYSYSPFGSPCDSGNGGPYPLGGVDFAGGQTPEVQLIATVTVTFAIQ